MTYDLERFVSAHNKHLDRVIRELEAGRKQTHWMWYVFPQVAGLGTSEASKIYAIKDMDEARAYWRDAGLRMAYITALALILEHEEDGLSAFTVLRSEIDLQKLRSSITLFFLSHPHVTILQEAVSKYGLCKRTIVRLGLFERLDYAA